MSVFSRPPLCDAELYFTDEEFAFAMAWEMYAPGLGGWTVHREMEDDGADIILVDPPLVYGDGFTLHREAGEVVISWSRGRLRVPSLREALLVICPLSPDGLEKADRLAALPTPSVG